ncbi:MarR family winged helix-turn-helix transcriptional regulator [Paenibacillus sp. KN14-4R]|uniref:MarR family winged helix-turn-helix transcriptional regulator n=1 Tax=Paenibacillus sp. KN14-4R TaxID=3445773 RepID=UPI003F9F39D9
MKQHLIQQYSELQNHLNLRLATKYQHKMDNQLTAKQVLLLELIRTGGSSTKELAIQLNISASAVSQLLNKLEEKEYITRTINKENRREIILKPAAKGERYFEDMHMLEDEVNRTVFGQLPLEDLEQLVRIMKKLNSIIEGD